MSNAFAKGSTASDVARHALIGLLLTSVHHAYGAYVYSTPWRLHVVFIAGAAALVILGALGVLRARPSGWPRTAAWWLLALTVLALPVVMVGVFEGLYNHVLKNVLYFGGSAAGTMARLFPPPQYEMPNDVFFEITGMLQVVPAALAALHLYRVMSSRRNEPLGVTVPAASRDRSASDHACGGGGL